ncbi:MAG TPA: galactose oxidase-like domain-containing protein [Actinomycetota bacterium]|nr:galactose oxidase-like domain-containing protein [Actinomycetota bacterium]
MHRRRALVPLAAVLALLGTLIAGGSVPAAAASPSTMGQFLPAFSENGHFDAAPPSNVSESTRYPTAVSLAAMPNGKLVYWNGLENLESDRYPLATDANRISPGSRSRQLAFDANGAPIFQVPTPEDAGEDPGDPDDQGDLFCADQRLLLDGTVAAIGGTVWKPGPVDLVKLSNGAITEPQGTTELHGNNATRIFSSDGNGGTWTPAERMNYGRWYPAVVTLPDGRLFVAGGVKQLIYNDSGLNVHQTEIFDPYDADGTYAPAQGEWTENGASGETSLPLFPRLHVIHDGTVLYDGVGQMWGPFGQAVDEALWNVVKSYDPATNSWTDRGVGAYGALSGAVSVMLPFTPDANGTYAESKILHAGGVLGTSPGAFVATDLSEVMTIGADGSLTATPGPRLNNRRWYSQGVIGATGDPLIFSGADKDEVIAPGFEAPVRQAEMYDVATGQFVPLASAARDRTYHNSAVLLADGRILIGGHAPINTLYGPGEQEGYTSNDMHNNTGLTANNLKDSSFEIFEPPYLHRGPRPSITSNVSGIMEWGTERSITTPDAATVDKAILVKMPATTHVTDPDARAIEVRITERLSGAVKIAVPDNAAVAIPGYYYLFLTRTNAGEAGPTVSNGIVVRVGSEAVFGGASADIAPVQLPQQTLTGSTDAGVTSGPAAAIGSAVVEPASMRATGSREARTGGRGGLLAVAAAAMTAATGAWLRRRRVAVRT